MCVCLCLGGMLWVFAKVRKVLDRLELEIQVVGRHATWILESEFLASAKRVHAVDHCVISAILLNCNLEHL